MNSHNLNPEEETFIVKVEVQRTPPISQLSDILTTMIYAIPSKARKI